MFLRDIQAKSGMVGNYATGARNLESSAGEIMIQFASTIPHVIASSADLLTPVQPQRTRSTAQRVG